MLFDADAVRQTGTARLAEDAVVLRGFVLPHVAAIMAAVAQVTAAAPWRHMVTPGGLRMTAAMSNCGSLGWVADRGGYRYQACDPVSGQRWPAMPALLAALATAAASAAGVDDFSPDACLLNRYVPGARMSLHQDRDEQDMAQPIVSISLGLPAIFLFGGSRRSDRAVRVPLLHGDVAVWGGRARLRYHGIAPLQAGTHPDTGACRINLTLRKAG